MMPFIEIAGAVERCQSVKRVSSMSQPSRSHQGGDIKPADERPHAAIMVVMREH